MLRGGICRGWVWDSVGPVWVCLVVCGDGGCGDGAVGADLESVAGCPFPDFGCAVLPWRTGDLGARRARPGDPDGLGDKVAGAACPLHGELGEHGAGDLVHGLAGPLVFDLAYGLGEFFQAE